MGCSVTGVKKTAGESPLQMGPKVEQTAQKSNFAVNLFRPPPPPRLRSHLLVAVPGTEGGEGRERGGKGGRGDALERDGEMQ
eukprot:2998162-Rhodomonas_salina.2